ncbi:MAG TPA: nucleotide sugar dehydrogenase [Acidimicrobiales bacterium]|nr:nucleotide sugar dehydrogenase [Acidimicrobiales bacterium]
MTDQVRAPEATDVRGTADAPLDPPDAAADLLRKLHDRTARILIVGQGYVGLPVSMRAVEVGFPVVGLEASPERAAALQAASSYVADVSDDQLRAALDAGYLPVSDPADAGPFDVAVITVPTPLRDGAPDLSYVEEAAATLARRLRAGALVVLESTTYPGTTDELVRPILEQSGLRAGEFLLGYSPERIDPGNARWGFVNTPKVVSGVDEASLRCVEAFYGALVDKVVPVGSTAEAELVKLLENTFRHVNIALVNELAMFADALDIDIWGAIDAASSKPFGYMRFTPGPGVGGHCLPIDPSYLSWRVKRRLGQTFRFVELANDVNEHMPDYVVTRSMTLLNRHHKSLNGSRVLVLGLSYKAGTSDWRESPSIAVVERLLAMGADVRACEPYIPEAGARALPAPVVGCTPDELAAADLVVLLVDHPDFPLDEIAEHAPLLLDTKGVMRPRRFSGETL